jgi:hypothetical protein
MTSRGSRSALGRCASILLCLTVSLLASSCAKKKVIVDPNDGLEGVPSPSMLTVWADTGIPDSTFRDLGLPGITPEDTLISATTTYFHGPGVVQGMVFDYTNANGFEAFRRDNGSFLPFQDFTIAPSEKFYPGHTDVFRFSDVPPGAITTQAYLARGVIADAGPAGAPKTNVGQVTRASVAGDLHYTAPTGIPPDFRPMSDSLLAMSWDPVPGAAWYFIHVYQFISQGGEDIVLSATPAPIYVSVVHDYWVGILPATVTAYKIGDPLPAGGRIFDSQPMLNGQVFQVRVSAVDANGQLISYTGTSGSFAIFRGASTYRKFPLGSVLVEPRRGGPSPARLRQPVAIATANPNLILYTGSTR